MNVIVDVVAVDCDGVIIDSIAELLKVSIECVGKFFPTKELNTKKAEELVVYFGGESFASGLKKALESLFPGKENKEKREECHQMIMKERIKIYDKVKPFPGAIETIKRLAKSYHLVISSGLEYAIIDNWLGRNGLGKCWFEMIYSLESGKKDIHIQLIREKFPGAKVFYVADSLKEMELGDSSTGVVSIGVAKESWHKEILLRGGAQKVISSLRKIFNVL